MEKKTQKGGKPDPESLTNSPGRSKKPLSTGKYLKDDPGWLGPFNSMVWQFPNSMLYITLVVGLCVYYGLRQKGYSTSPFIGAAVVEVLLSTDNICLFHQIFEHFRVPREIRPGLLFIGTPFMVLIRGLLFFALKGIYDYLKPLMLVLGAFCMWQGAYVFYQTIIGEEDDDEDPSNSTIVKWAKGCLGGRMVDKYHGSAIWIYVEGILRITPMLLVIVVIELTDVAFCIDGVSTIFMVDHVHVSTLFLGDIVAACLVRALYPQLAGTVELFPDLNYSVACVLVLVGVDMCSGVFGHDFPPGFLALAMAVLFTLGMASSVMRGVCRKEEAAAAEETKALLGDSKYGATK
tara:strand:+ start:2411 stop:3454 length:1044 start_codon:yes stop_codon:yes gene_type:complete